MKRLLLGLALLLTACTKPLPDKATVLVYATPYSPNHPFSRADKAWITHVEASSGGSLKIRPVWSGALLSSDMSMTELRHGIADIGLITPIYVKGGEHLIRVQAGFYSGMTEIEQQVALYRCMASHHAQFAKETEGLHVLALQGGSLPGIITRTRPVRSLDDLKGLRLRVPSELSGTIKALGADPVNMPMGEVYSSLAKGVIDGVVAPADTFRSLHFAEVAKYFTPLKVPRGAYPSRAIGQKRWDSLTAQQRQVLTDGIAVWEAALAKENRAAIALGLKSAADHKVEILSVSPADQQRFDDLYLAHAREHAQTLSDYGIDGNAVFATARKSVTPSGHVDCKE